MIPMIPRFFFILTLLLIGPSRPEILMIVFIGSIFVLAMTLRRSFRYRTIALLSILGIMLVQSLQPFVGLDILFRPHLFHGGAWDLFSTLFTLNLGLSIMGVLAAAFAAAYIEFGKSRMAVAKIFPELGFLEAPTQVKSVVKDLARSARIQPPDVSLVDSGTPSAFTIRSNRKYTVAVSVGLLESLEADEVKACLAHEISHLKNRDFTWRFLATLAKVALFAKPLSYLIEPAIYRAREFQADRTAVELVGGPGALISALSKLGESQSLGMPTLPASVCACNLNRGSVFPTIFGKHPTIHARISALQEMDV